MPGPALNVVRVSDGSALDIGFVPSGALDETLFAGSAPRPSAASPNGMTRAVTTTTRPKTSPGRGRSFDCRTGSATRCRSLWDFEMTSGAPPRFLVLPDGVSLNSGSMGMLWTGPLPQRPR